MGIFRLYLALCVVAAHAGVSIFPWAMHQSKEAVEIFFIISGFYMSLIASKYTTAREFYMSRALRIYVPYYVILGFVILLSVLFGVFFGHWLALDAYVHFSPTKNGIAGAVFTATTNLTIFFQDWTNFLQHDAGTNFSFTTHFLSAHSPLYLFLLIPPSWTISLELTFYLLVPLLEKWKTRWLFLIAAVSFGLRVYAYNHGLAIDPFTYRFFPFELLWFAIGIISHRVYARTLARVPAFKLTGLFQYLAFVAFLIFLFYLTEKSVFILRRPFGKLYAPLVMYVFWAVAIPFLFHLTRDLKWDRFIGELSYPVYLIHFTIIQAMVPVLAHFSIPSHYLGVICGVLAVGISVLLYVKVFRPFEQNRQELVHNLIARWQNWRKVPNTCEK